MVAQGSLTRLGDPVDPAPTADDPLDVAGGAGAAHRQQTLFGLWSRYTSQRPHFGVRELATRQSLSQARQGRQGARYAHAFPGRAQVEPHAPAQPGGAGAESRVPAAALVELTDEIEQAGSGGLEVCLQLGDLITEPTKRCVVDAIGRVIFHGESPFAGATLHLSFGGAWKARRATIGRGRQFFANG